MDYKAIEVINLKKKFNGITIFSNFNFSLDTNKRCLIYGKNGSGKTTLLKILSGYLYPDEGEVIVLGKNLIKEEKSLKGKIFYVSPEERSFYFPLSVEKNLNFFLKVSERYEWEKLNEFIEIFNIKYLLKKPFSVLSSGEKQRVALVRAFSLDPEIFLLDEPQKSLDEEGTNILKSLISNLKEKTFIIATPKKEIFDEITEINYNLC